MLNEQVHVQIGHGPGGQRIPTRPIVVRRIHRSELQEQAYTTMVLHVILANIYGAGRFAAADGVPRVNRRLVWSAAVGAVGIVIATMPVAGQADAAAAPFGFYSATRVQVGADSVGVAIDSQTDTLYAAVTGSKTHGIAVIDGATNTVSGFVPTTGQPVAVAVDDATDTVYAAYPNQVAVIDGETNTVTSTVDAGSTPRAIAVNPLTDTIYVATNPLRPEILVINGQTDQVTSTILVLGDGAMTVDPDTGNLYLAIATVPDVQVISGSSGQSIATIKLPVPPGFLPAEPGGLAVDPAAGEVFATDPFTGQVCAISAASNTVSVCYTVPAGSPQAVAVDPADGLLFTSTSLGLGDFEGRISVLSETTGALAYDAVIPRGGASLAVNTATGSVYATDNPQAESLMAGYVSVITPNSTATTMSPVIQNQPSSPLDGFPFSFTYDVSESPVGTVTETGALPAGVQFANGVLSGTPAADTGGQYPVQVTASNGIGPADTESYVLTVRQPIVVTGPTRATLRTGRHASLTYTATGYPAPTFNTASGLPAWLRLSPTGVLSGTPTAHAGGKYNAWIGATNLVLPLGAGVGVQLTVDEPASFKSARHVTFAPDVRKKFTIRTWGFPAPHLTVSGKLPTGLKFRLGRDGTATLTGRAARLDAGRTYKITITARNGIGRVARQTLVIRVS